jgi:hypothetical protein
MTTGSRVKLYVYEKHGKETIINSVTGEDWDDFILVRLDVSRDPYEQESLFQQFSEYFPNKKLVIVPNTVDIEFYGFTTTPPLESAEDD